MSREIDWEELAMGQRVSVVEVVPDASRTTEGIVAHTNGTILTIGSPTGTRYAINPGLIQSITLLAEPEPPEGSIISLTSVATSLAQREPEGWVWLVPYGDKGPRVECSWEYISGFDGTLVVIRHGWDGEKK